MDQITPSIHAATPESARARLAALNWEDPFGIDTLLAEEERMIRDAARAYAQRAGQVCADTTAAELRASAASALDVLADVFSRAEQRATELAGIADERWIAGAACVRLYQEARATLIAAP